MATTYLTVAPNYSGQEITLPFPYTRQEFVIAISSDLTALDVRFTAPGKIVLPVTGGTIHVKRRTPRDTGLTDFGTGGRLLKDSVMGEYALRVLHRLEEDEDEGNWRCALRGPSAPPPPPPPPPLTSGEIIWRSAHGPEAQAYLAANGLPEILDQWGTHGSTAGLPTDGTFGELIHPLGRYRFRMRWAFTDNEGNMTGDGSVLHVNMFATVTKLLEFRRWPSVEDSNKLLFDDSTVINVGAWVSAPHLSACCGNGISGYYLDRCVLEVGLVGEEDDLNLEPPV